MPSQVRHAPCIYQIRVGPREGPYDLVARLAHAAWTVITEEEGLKGLDVHLWQSIYVIFRDVFSPRVSYYPECGYLRFCSKNLRRVYDSKGEPAAVKAWTPASVYTLELPRGAGHFVQAMTALVMRRIRGRLSLAPDERRGLEARLILGLENALSHALFHSNKCRTCWVRKGPAVPSVPEDVEAWR